MTEESGTFPISSLGVWQNLLFLWLVEDVSLLSVIVTVDVFLHTVCILQSLVLMKNLLS